MPPIRDYGVPFIYAGNQDVREQVERIFRGERRRLRISANVMPEINDFHIETVNEAIRELFQTVIIRAKGFDVVEEYMDAPFIPTPRAAFRGINCWPTATATAKASATSWRWTSAARPPTSTPWCATTRSISTRQRPQKEGQAHHPADAQCAPGPIGGWRESTG
jgi:hypothetical protein